MFWSTDLREGRKVRVSNKYLLCLLVAVVLD